LLKQEKGGGLRSIPLGISSVKNKQGGDPLAALVGVVTLRFAALPRAGDRLAAQFREALYDDSRRDLGSNFTLRLARFLWDSQGTLANAGGPRGRIPAGIRASCLWDSNWLKTR